MTESWDCDPDLDFDEADFTTLATPTLAHSATATSSNDVDARGHSVAPLSFTSTISAAGDNALHDSRDLDFDPFERTPAIQLDSTDSALSPEEENQSSTGSSRNGTLKGLLSSFSGLSLDSPPTGVTPFPRSDSNSTLSSSASSSSEHTQTLSSGGGPSTPKPSNSRRNSSPNRTPLATGGGKPGYTTLRPGSNLSTLLASAVSGPGRVHHLGSTPQGAAKSVLGDWDEDLELGGLDGLGLPRDLEGQRELRGKSSFASHISDDVEGDAFLQGASAGVVQGLPTPRSGRKLGGSRPALGDRGLTSRASTSSFTDPEEDDLDGLEVESDFELPDDVAHITLSPLLARASNSSLNSHSRGPSASSSSATLPLPTPTLLTQRAPSRHSTASPGLSMGGTTTDDDDEDDEAFFEEIVLPPYFLGGPGAMTPPSDGERFEGAKIDLQGMLKRKLEARGGKADGSGGRAAGSKLDGYREREGEEEDGDGEMGLVIELGVKLGEERMRTRSGPKPPQLLKGRRVPSTISAMSSGGGGQRSRSTAPPLPHPTTSITRPLSRSGSSTSLSTLSSLRSPHSSTSTVPSPGPSPNRPSSAAGQVERPSTSRTERRGPPPAPSTAARDRVRTRTVSLRTTSSSGDLRGAAAAAAGSGMATPAGGRRPPRLETTTPRGGVGATVLSPVPMTHSTPSATPGGAGGRPTLRSKRSTGNLLATPSSIGGGRAMERKRSLQALPKLELDRGTPASAVGTGAAAGRRQLRSPTPSTPGTSSLSGFFSPSSTPTPSRGRTIPSSFAAPTAASISRVRERVSSNPVLPPSLSPLPSSLATFAAHHAHPPRPSSAASGRLLQPTASSAAKRTAPSPSSASSSLAGLRIPLKLARPKKARAYGDGTELDGFDDLPLTKGERERERTVSLGVMQRRRSSGVGGTTINPSPAQRRTGSAGSGSGSGSREGGSTIKVKVGAGKVVPANATLAPPSASSSSSSKRAKAESAEEGIEKKPKVVGGGVKEDKTGGRKKKREPQLIRNLGAPAVAKVHGEMTWNPQLHRWEGNESALREFDKALSSSTRPALITQLSSPNASRIGFPSLIVPTSPSPPSPAAVVPTALTAPNVKVVGSMVFDPVRMSWHSLAGDEGEDELDLMFDGPGGDWADDEGGERAPSSLGGSGAGDGWEMGEQARMLKSRASFVLSECGDGESGDEGDGDARRRLRRECEEGEKRSREEMSAWMRREGVNEEKEMREMLYEIRTLIMDMHPSPRR